MPSTMEAVGFRSSNLETYRAAATRRGIRLSDWLREAADSAARAEGFSTASETQWALVSNGELVRSACGGVSVTFRPAADSRGEWLPIENEDDQPFDKAKHWRLKPLPLRVDGDRVVRTYPVVAKSQEHA